MKRHLLQFYLPMTANWVAFVVNLGSAGWTLYRGDWPTRGMVSTLNLGASSVVILLLPWAYRWAYLKTAKADADADMVRELLARMQASDPTSIEVHTDFRRPN